MDTGCTDNWFGFVGLLAGFWVWCFLRVCLFHGFEVLWFWISVVDVDGCTGVECYFRVLVG